MKLDYCSCISSAMVVYVIMFYFTEEELIIPDPTKGKKALAAILRLKNKPRYATYYL